LEQRLAQQSPAARLGRDRQSLDELMRRAAARLTHGIELHRARLVGAQAQLAALNPRATLGRGYAIVRRADDGAIVADPAQVRSGDALVVTVKGGDIGVRADGVVSSKRGKR
jgi:exodeoxyribonuclease VII large subunit